MEARVLMLSSRNLMLPSNGKLAMAANQDIVLGNYYLTALKYPEPKKDDYRSVPHFNCFDEVISIYEHDEFMSNQKGKTSYQRKLNIHTWIRVKINNKFILTTVGRVIFNQVLPKEMPFVNTILTKPKLNDLAMDCFNKVGQVRTAEFLDDMKTLGFRYATKAGITFSASDVVSPVQKDRIIEESEQEIQKIINSYMNGEITESERINRVIDKWKMATERVTDVLMDELAIDQDGFNPINMMYVSKARGGKDQIKQLGGMRGLMDKPSKGTSETVSEVIETPIKSNFKEGLTVLEYFISTHGARKGLADTALKTADAGYLTRRLVDVAQNAIITMEDCGTLESITVSALKEGLEVIEPLHERIKGRIAAVDIEDPVTEKVIVHANTEITDEKALMIQNHGINKVKIRSAVTCETERGICIKCYGRNLATGKLVTIGEPVGVIAAQSIGEPGTQLTLRTFHIGGSTRTDVDLAQVTCQGDGTIQFEKMNYVKNRNDEMISITSLGKINIVNDIGEVQESYRVEYAATIYVRDGQKVVKDTTLFSWDHYNNPLISTAKGRIKFDNFILDETFKEEFNELTGQKEITIIESKNRQIQPQFKIIAEDGTTVLVPLAKSLNIEVEDGTYVYEGDVLGKSSKITVRQSDITGGLPRVQDFFEARSPKNKAILSEIAGTVKIGDLSKSGRTIVVKADDDTEKKYIIPPGKRITVHDGDILESGDALCDGQLDPHDILKAKGKTAAQMLIINEIQEVYRKQGVKIDDKHLGVIIRQMFKKVRIVNPGHTLFLEGEIIDKNQVEQENKRINEEGGEGATYEQLLLGITKASLLTDSWLSAASFQETTKILTQAAVEGSIDNLEGLKESIIIGHRIPVGTGTKYYQQKVQKALSEGKAVGDIIRDLAHPEEEESIESLLDI
jgi:DNA-directed RNA polymerase subunit beta'